MGDAVMALPFIRGARSAGIGVSLCAAPGPAGVFRLAFPDIPLAVFNPESHAWWRGGEWQGWRERMGSDAAVCAWGDPRVHFWMKQAGFTRRAGLPAAPCNSYAREAAMLRPLLAGTAWCGRAMEWLTGPLLTDPWTRPRRGLHHQDNWTALARILGFEVDAGVPWFRPPAVQGAGPGEGGLWVVHPGGRLPWKHWPVENWEKLLATLARVEGIRTVLVQGEGIPRLVNLPPGQRVHVGGGLDDFAALLGSAEGLVGLDSFPAHLSAALGKKTVVLFGDMPDCWFSPRGEQVRLVRTERGGRSLRDYRRAGRSLLHAVTVGEVVEAIHLGFGI